MNLDQSQILDISPLNAKPIEEPTDSSQFCPFSITCHIYLVLMRCFFDSVPSLSVPLLPAGRTHVRRVFRSPSSYISHRDGLRRQASWLRLGHPEFSQIPIVTSRSRPALPLVPGTYVSSLNLTTTLTSIAASNPGHRDLLLSADLTGNEDTTFTTRITLNVVSSDRSFSSGQKRVLA